MKKVKRLLLVGSLSLLPNYKLWLRGRLWRRTAYSDTLVQEFVNNLRAASGVVNTTIYS